MNSLFNYVNCFVTKVSENRPNGPFFNLLGLNRYEKVINSKLEL
ncbi:hypothetical protein DOT_3706 [Desulfosporosinus sp. OT]|nr:hypothetical protein DOT_3706 [Desulfosporosinus sp. OT]